MNVKSSVKHFRKGYLERLNDSVQIESLIAKDVRLKPAGREQMTGLCPFHEEKTPSFKVFTGAQNHYHCFGCGAHGDPISYVMARMNLTFPEAVMSLAEEFHIPIEYDEGSGVDEVVYKENNDLYFVLTEASARYQSEIGKAQTYVAQRGLNAESISTFEIGYAPKSRTITNALQKQVGQDAVCKAGLVTVDGKQTDVFINRLMFPVHDWRGRIVGFTARTLDDAYQPKYKNSPKTPLFSKSNLLYGLYQALKYIRTEAIVVEGAMDMVMLHQHGVKNVVATLGTALSEVQIKTLFRRTEEIVCCFDGDKAGQDATWRAMERMLPCLQDGKTISFVALPEGEDPDSFIRKTGGEGFLSYLKERKVTLTTYFLEQLKARYGTKSVEQLVSIKKAAFELIKVMDERSLITQELIKQVNQLSTYSTVDLNTAKSVEAILNSEAGDVLLPVGPFNPELLPEKLRPWLTDIAERMQCPLDFLAISAITVISSLIGGRIQVQPYQFNLDWVEFPNLWGIIIGDPGAMKSPPMKEVKAPLAKLQREALLEYGLKIKDFTAEEMSWEAELRSIESKLSRFFNTQTDTSSRDIKNAVVCEDITGDELLTRVKVLKEMIENKPKPRRYITSDATTEKLGEVLLDNPQGVLFFRDELTGWFNTFNKSGRETDRQFFIESWAGNDYSVDRIGRGSFHVPLILTSVLGSMQPGVAKKFVREAHSDTVGEDGLLQRFQLIAWPNLPTHWRIVDRTPDLQAKEVALSVFDKLNAIPLPSLNEVNELTHIRLKFDWNAQNLFNEWLLHLMNTRVIPKTLSRAMRSHLSKFKSLVPSLALIFHLIDDEVTHPISKASLERAIQWADYLEKQAARMYHSTIEQEHFVPGRDISVQRLRILSLVARGYSAPSEIEKAGVALFPDMVTTTIRKLLFNMVKDGQLDKVDRGCYQVNQDYLRRFDGNIGNIGNNTKESTDYNRKTGNNMGTSVGTFKGTNSKIPGNMETGTLNVPSDHQNVPVMFTQEHGENPIESIDVPNVPNVPIIVEIILKRLNGEKIPLSDLERVVCREQGYTQEEFNDSLYVLREESQIIFDGEFVVGTK